MARLRRGGSGCGDHDCFVDTGRRDNVGDAGLPFGQGTSLVEYDGLNPAHPFQRGGILDEDVVPGTQPRCHSDGGRSCQAQGIGAGDHHGRDRKGERGEEGLAGYDAPADKGQHPGPHRHHDKD